MNHFNLQWVIEGVLARSCRPCYHEDVPTRVALNKWLNEAAIMKIRGILCLLSQKELQEFYGAHGIDLLAWYRNRGFVACHMPVADYLQPPLTNSDLATIRAAFKELPKPCLVHCSAGIDRTGAAVELILKELKQSGSF